jgi:carboxyl-terminal processing protease
MKLVNRLLSLIGIIAFNSFTFAADAVAPQVYAVVIAPGQFADAQIKPRPSAQSDGEAIYDLLTNPEYLGVPKDRIKLLISGEDATRNASKATKENILAAIKDVGQKAKKEDLVILTFLGQGASSGERACFFATDSSFKERGKTAILASDLEPLFKTFPAQLAVFLDIYVKGFDAGKETVLEPNVGEFTRAFLGFSDKEEVTLPTGRAIVIAGAGIATPLTVDEGKRGIFTKVLLDALKGDADKEGGQADGNVTIDELSSHLERELPALARQLGKTNDEKIQSPLSIRDSSTHFIISHNPSVFAQVKKNLDRWKVLSEEKKVPAEVAEEGVRLLSRMPKLKLYQDLRNDYQKAVTDKITVDDLLKQRESILESMKLATEDARSYSSTVLTGLEFVDRAFVKEVNLGELTAKAIRGLYVKAEEKIPEAIQKQLEQAKQLKKSDLRQLLVDARLPLGKREDLDNKGDIEASLDMAMRKLDPYTQYIPKELVERTNSSVSGLFTGIGVQIRRDLVRDGLLVVTPIKGSPAYKAQIKQGDLITKIRRKVDSQGNPLPKEEITSTKGMRVDDAVKLILGKPGTEVEITVEREGEKEPLEFKLRRGRVEVESVLGYQRNSDDSWDYFVDPKTKIGYIRLTSFARKSNDDMKAAVEELVKQGMKGLVLDLRFNPGGYLNVANDICDLFIDDGIIVGIKERGKEPRAMTGETKGSQTFFPMVCMVNGFSASGSEIVGACLTDHHRAVIVGERSFGKGSVQTIQPFEPTGGEIKLTTAAFLAPTFRNLNKSSTSGKEEEDWGVRPDPGFNIKLTPEEQNELADRLQEREIIPNRALTPKKEVKPFTDKQLDVALDYLRKQIKLTGSASNKKED